MSFQDKKAQLLAALEDKPLQSFNTEGSWQWFIKGDVSGIQEFIFSVKSDKASKQLKERSKFVEKQTEAALKVIKSKHRFEEVYNGGGNFYGLLEDIEEKDFNTLSADLNKDLVRHDLYLAMTKTPVTQQDLTHFDTIWRSIQKESVKDKFRKYSYAIVEEDAQTQFDLIFKAYKDIQSPLESDKADKKDKLALWSPTLRQKYSDLIAEFKEVDKAKEPKERIPVVDNNIIEFRYLSAFAKLRTGTEKLAVLKMDVDFLGDTFNNRKTLSSVKALSDSLKWYFDDYFETLLAQSFGTNGDVFQDNIYVVFAGGDDCFMVGAWDAIFQFAKVLRESFEDFTNDQLKLSASLTLIDEKYPVIRFARLAEEALKNAKELKKEGELTPPKNRISVFNQILEWDEFYEAQAIAQKLEDLIKNKGESRAIIERIKRSRYGFEKMQGKINEGFLKAQEVWRLQWFLRSSKNIKEMQAILNHYHRLLLKEITEGPINPMLFPVAARWAEFLTKNKGDYTNPTVETE